MPYLDAIGASLGAGAGAAAGRAGSIWDVLSPLDFPRQALWNLARSAYRGTASEGTWGDVLRAAPALAGGLAGVLTGGGSIPLSMLIGSAAAGGLQGLGKMASPETFAAPEVSDLTGTESLVPNLLVGALGDPLSYAGLGAGRTAARSLGGAGRMAEEVSPLARQLAGGVDPMAAALPAALPMPGAVPTAVPLAGEELLAALGRPQAVTELAGAERGLAAALPEAVPMQPTAQALPEAALAETAAAAPPVLPTPVEQPAAGGSLGAALEPRPTGEALFSGAAPPAPVVEAPPGPIFYSHLERSLEKLPPSIKAESLINVLKKQGVKDAELAGNKIQELVEARSGQKLTKKEIADHVAENKIVVEEHLYEGDKTIWDKYEGGIKHQKGGQDYKELVLRAPFNDPENLVGGSSAASHDLWTEYKDLTSRVPGIRMDRDTAKLRIGVHERAGEEIAANHYRGELARLEKELAEALSRTEGNIDKLYKLEKSNIMNGHFPEDANVLAHIRFDTRIGPQGEKILYIHEIQSDWMQHAKNVAQLGSPFEKDWSELAMKRMLRWAADNDFEKIAVTTGEVAAQHVGGKLSGQQQFYDKDLGGFLKKHGKAYGVEVEQVQIKPRVATLADGANYKSYPAREDIWKRAGVSGRPPYQINELGLEKALGEEDKVAKLLSDLPDQYKKYLPLVDEIAESYKPYVTAYPAQYSPGLPITPKMKAGVQQGQRLLNLAPLAAGAAGLSPLALALQEG